MGEAFEGVFSMIGADAAVADAAERQVRIGEMPVGVVDAAAAKPGPFDPCLFCLPVPCKEIKGQRIGMFPNEDKGLLRWLYN